MLEEGLLPLPLPTPRPPEPSPGCRYQVLCQSQVLVPGGKERWPISQKPLSRSGENEDPVPGETSRGFSIVTTSANGPLARNQQRDQY